MYYRIGILMPKEWKPLIAGIIISDISSINSYIRGLIKDDLKKRGLL